jgi:hypothetical protein
VFAAASVACGGVANPGTSGSPGTLTNATSDFDGLGKWCEGSVSAIADTRGANPIRADELKEKHLKQLSDELLHKEIRWRLKVEVISTKAVSVRSFRTRKVEINDARGRPSQTEFLVFAAQFNESEFQGEDLRYDPKFAISNISREKLRSISVGDFVVVVGKVKDISLNGDIYRIKIADAKVE